jgi:hypothetical protein
MRKMLPFVVLVLLTLSSSSSGKPKAGDNCGYVDGQQLTYTITENGNVDELYCSSNNEWVRVEKYEPTIAPLPPKFPKAGDFCGGGITENANGDEMYCSKYNVWRHVD